jgi:phosphate-selective porin OprO and OprP
MRLAAILLIALALPLRADDVDERLKKLEQEVADLRKENDQLRRDLGLEVVARQADVKMNGRSEGLQLGGMVQAQTDFGDRGDSRFSDSNARAYLRRLRFGAQGRFVEEFNFRVEMELAGSLGNSTGFRAQLTDAYVNWNRFESANVRVGQFKTPFGFEQLYLDPRLYFVERTLVNDRLTPGRQIGAQIGGEAERFNYAVGFFNGNGTNQNFNDNDRFMSAGRVSVTPLSGRLFDQPSRWTVGVNAFRSRDANVTVAPELGIDSTPASAAKDNIFIGRRGGLGYDTQVEIGPFEAWAEYLRGTFDPDDKLPLPRLRSGGWYGHATYYVIIDKLQVVARRDVFDASRSVNGDDTRTTTLGVNWYFKQHDLKLQVDWLRSDVPGLARTQSKWLARLQTMF